MGKCSSQAHLAQFSDARSNSRRSRSTKLVQGTVHCRINLAVDDVSIYLLTMFGIHHNSMKRQGSATANS